MRVLPKFRDLKHIPMQPGRYFLTLVLGMCFISLFLHNKLSQNLGLEITSYYFS